MDKLRKIPWIIFYTIILKQLTSVTKTINHSTIQCSGTHLEHFQMLIKDMAARISELSIQAWFQLLNNWQWLGPNQPFKRIPINL